jgi:hypothetical protein
MFGVEESWNVFHDLLSLALHHSLLSLPSSLIFQTTVRLVEARLHPMDKIGRGSVRKYPRTPSPSPQVCEADRSYGSLTCKSDVCIQI